MFEIGHRPVLVDLQVFLALVGFSLSVVAVIIAAGRLRDGARSHVRTLWWVVLSASGAFALVSAAIALIAGRYPASPVALIVGGAMSLVILGLLIAVRVASFIIDEGYQRQADLAEARKALSDHQSGLQALVTQRTQSLRKEINERRSVQKKLYDWNQQRERELAMAGRVQKALLPTITSPSFCKVELVYRPYEEVSGDTYMFASSDQELSLVLADAMGHGVPAALVTQVIQTQFLRMGVTTEGNAMFAQFNESLFRGAQVTYATASHLRVCSDGQAYITSAGAPSLMIWRARSKTIDVIDGSGFPLGMFDDVGDEYCEHPVELAVGDKLFLYTDGLSELKTSMGTHFGEDGLVAWFRQYAHESPASISVHVEKDLIGRDSAYELSDDITLAVMEYTGAGLS